MKVFQAAILVVFLAGGVTVFAQSPDTFFIANTWVSPGDTANISLSMRNTQFAVAAFTMRVVLRDSLYTNFVAASRGSNVVSFDHFNAHINYGTVKISGIARLPGGNNPPLLYPGYHELARVTVAIGDTAVPGQHDSLYFMDDLIPPDRDNSISDSTGYVNEVPTLIGAEIQFEIPTGTIDDIPEFPSQMELYQNYPNPFNAHTRIGFWLASDTENVKLDIFDIMGRGVMSFSWSDLSAGSHDIVWEGRDSGGDPLSSGIYFYRLSAQDRPVECRRMTLLK